MHFAVIPTVGERNATLIPMVRQLTHDGVTVIIVHNSRDGSPEGGLWDADFDFPHHNPPFVSDHVWDDGEPVNLSKVWNLGLDWAHELANGAEYTVAVLNDDLVIPAGLVETMADAIERTNSAAAFAAYWSSPTAYQKFDDRSPWHLGNRMIGYAFALRGSVGLRADEDFLWWWGDSDLDLRARQAGGVVAVQVPGLEHLDPNGYTNRNPALYEQAGHDRETFRRKHGFLPW